MVGSFSFSIRLPFPMISFFGYWGLFAFRPVLMAGFSVSVFVSSVVAHPSLRLDGGLKGFFVRSPLGVVFRFSSFLFALRSLRQVVRSSFSVFSDGSCLSSVSLSPSSRFSSSLFPFLLSDGLRFLLDSFQGSFLFVFVPFFRLFALGSTSFPFPFSLIRPALPFISFVVFGFLSTSLHRDAPSGGGVGRAAWPRRIRRIGRT